MSAHPGSERELTPFGRWLNDRLDERGLTRRQFALRMGATSSAVQRWVYRNRPTPESCRRIAEALDVPIDQVLAAAGHLRPTPAGDASPRREEARHLLELVPEPLLIPLLPMLRGLVDHAAQLVEELSHTVRPPDA